MPCRKTSENGEIPGAIHHSITMVVAPRFWYWVFFLVPGSSWVDKMTKEQPSKLKAMRLSNSSTLFRCKSLETKSSHRLTERTSHEITAWASFYCCLLLAAAILMKQKEFIGQSV